MPNKAMDSNVIHDIFILPAMRLIPTGYNTPAARAMLIAIGKQESKFMQRRQLIGNLQNWWESTEGPATSFWQFERHCIQSLLNHRMTGHLLKSALITMGYPPRADIIHHAIVHNDILAACCARLLLLTYPGPLPMQGAPEQGWKQYLWCWKPGKPRPERWDQYFADAWDMVGQ